MSTKFQSDILIQRLDGTTYDLGAEGIRVVTFDPPSPAYAHTYAQTSNYGATLGGTQITQVSIPLTFDVIAHDNFDYELQRLKVLQIFSSVEPFYVISLRTPFMRWKVVAEPFSYPRSGNYWKAKNVAVNLVCYEGLAESIATTLQNATVNGHEYDASLGVPLADYNYQFHTTNFKVYNPSIIPLLADERPVTILFKGRASSGLTITNRTTSQTFTYKKPINTSDDFKLIGLVPIMNGIQRLGNDYSSRSFIDLARGYNNFEISGASDFTISFETRFYY